MSLRSEEVIARLEVAKFLPGQETLKLPDILQGARWSCWMQLTERERERERGKREAGTTEGRMERQRNWDLGDIELLDQALHESSQPWILQYIR